jgi:hypothetical protein
MSGLPPATSRCWDCGVGSGPCQCTREFALFEAAEEERLDAEQEHLDYLDTISPDPAALAQQGETP